MNRAQLAEWLDHLFDDDEPVLTARDFHVLTAIRDELSGQSVPSPEGRQP